MRGKTPFLMSAGLGGGTSSLQMAFGTALPRHDATAMRTIQFQPHLFCPVPIFAAMLCLEWPNKDVSCHYLIMPPMTCSISEDLGAGNCRATPSMEELVKRYSGCRDAASSSISPRAAKSFLGRPLAFILFARRIWSRQRFVVAASTPAGATMMS